MYEEHETPHHYKHFTRYGIKDQLERNGYVGISVKPSSASLPAAMYLSRIAVEDDLGVYSPNTNSINRPLRRLHSGIAKILIAGVFYFVSFGKQDREPHSGTRMPIGWVVKAFKPEEPRWKRERRLSKVTDFLVANSAASQNYEISKGALRPRS